MQINANNNLKHNLMHNTFNFNGNEVINYKFDLKSFFFNLIDSHEDQLDPDFFHITHCTSAPSDIDSTKSEFLAITHSEIPDNPSESEKFLDLYQEQLEYVHDAFLAICSRLPHITHDANHYFFSTTHGCNFTLTFTDSSIIATLTHYDL